MFAIESRNPVDSFLWQGGTVSPLEEKKRNRDRVASRLKSLELSLTEQFKSRPPVKMPKDKFLSTLEVLMEDIISNHQHIKDMLVNYSSSRDRGVVRSAIGDIRDMRVLILELDKSIAELEMLDLLNNKGNREKTAFSVEDINKIINVLPYSPRCLGIGNIEEDYYLGFEIGEHLIRPSNNYRSADSEYLEYWTRDTLADFYHYGIMREPLKFFLSLPKGRSANIHVPFVDNLETIGNFRNEEGDEVTLGTRTSTSVRLNYCRDALVHPHLQDTMLDTPMSLKSTGYTTGCLGSFFGQLQQAVKNKSFVGLVLTATNFLTSFDASDSWGRYGMRMFHPDEVNYSEDKPKKPIEPWSPLIFFNKGTGKLSTITPVSEGVTCTVNVITGGGMVTFKDLSAEQLVDTDFSQPEPVLNIQVVPSLGTTAMFKVG